MKQYSVVKLIFSDEKGVDHIRLFKTLEEAKNTIKLMRSCASNTYCNYRIKVVKPK